MKKTNFLHLILLGLIILSCQSKKHFNISGTINPVQDSIIKLEYIGQDSTYILEHKIENGQFSFEGSINEATFGSILYRNGIPAHFMIEPGSKTEISIQDRKAAIHSSSNFTNLYDQYSSTKNQKTKDSIVKVFSKTFIDEDLYAEMVSGWLSRSKPKMDNQKEIRKLLIESNNNSEKMELIMTYFERNEVTQIGNIIPNLPYLNEFNQPTSIIDPDSKYTLIDFWATWCGPCKLTNEYLVYYKDQLATKGVSITSVSIEKDIDIWKKGSLKEGISWNNVIDTTGISMDALKFKQIPFALLVDQQGKIIISNMNVKDIEELAINDLSK